MNFTTKIKDINIAATLPFSVGIGHSINNEVEEIDLSKCPQENSYFMDFEMSSTLKVDNFALASEEDTDVFDSTYIPSAIISSMKEAHACDERTDIEHLLSQFESDLLDDEISDDEEEEERIDKNDVGEQDEGFLNDDTNIRGRFQHKLNCKDENEDILTIDCGEGDDSEDDNDSSSIDSYVRQQKMESLCGTFDSASLQTSGVDAELQSLLSQCSRLSTCNFMNNSEVVAFNLENSRSFTDVLPFE